MNRKRASSGILKVFRVSWVATQRLTCPFLLLKRIKKVYFWHFKRDQFCFLLDVSFERAGQAADSQQDIESDVEYKRCLLLKMAEKHHQTGANGQSGQSKHLPGLHPQNLVMIYLIFVPSVYWRGRLIFVRSPLLCANKQTADRFNRDSGVQAPAARRESPA